MKAILNVPQEAFMAVLKSKEFYFEVYKVRQVIFTNYL